MKSKTLTPPPGSRGKKAKAREQERLLVILLQGHTVSIDIVRLWPYNCIISITGPSGTADSIMSFLTFIREWEFSQSLISVGAHSAPSLEA